VSRPAGSPGAALLLAAGLLGAWPGLPGAEDADPHAKCREAAAASQLKRATRTTADYTLPAVTLVRDDGRAVTLPEELADGRPVILNFVYTTCTTICPLMSATFAQLQDRLGSQRDKVHMISVSIDPEEDTPERLAEYARRFHAGPQWRLYTGTTEASVATQRAFAAFRGDKMGHTPVTFLRAGPGRRWVRIDGFASADELARELRELVATR
jgi:protein SCO1/2